MPISRRRATREDFVEMLTHANACILKKGGGVSIRTLAARDEQQVKKTRGGR